ncbi:uncharacterized protein LOC135495320 [Lineus longissimus]|uniref:uncharacterized protein LOC135495320 n=1 Tax=Lineus longissimus TaxID=88925 RepID=UPI00315DA533
MTEVHSLTLDDLEAATSTKCELECMRHLHRKLSVFSEDAHIYQTDEEFLEDQFLSTTADDENPFPLKNIHTLCPTQEELNRFTHYLFERRYGWSEGLQADGKKPRIRRLGSVVTSLGDEKTYKSSINEVLDDFIRWYKHQPISSGMVECLKCSISEAVDKPVVRNQTYVHIMEWLRTRLQDLDTEENFGLVKNLIISGLTDVWSKIRNSCASRLSPVVERLPVMALESFFTELVQLCLKPDASWQAKEGAMMGVNVIMKRFHWTGMEESWVPKSPKPEYMLKFGQQELKNIPEFISDNIKGLIYPMLAHPQLTIRENAIKTFSSYMLRCDAKETLCALHDAVVELCKNTTQQESGNGCDKATCMTLPHLAVLRKDFTFMDAYNAEGLLGICLFLVKHIPATQLLPNWDQYFSTFSLYLMHPASTVRQATSNVFKFLVAKDSSHPVILKYILHDLSVGWDADLNMMTQPIGLDTGHIRRRSLDVRGLGKVQVTSERENLPADAWEWREGRLFAYELILKFLIKNHWLYTFGPSSSGIHGTPRLSGSMDEGTLSRFLRPLKKVKPVNCSKSCHLDLELRDRPHTPVRRTPSGGLERPHTPVRWTPSGGMRGHAAIGKPITEEDHRRPGLDAQRHVSVCTSTPTEEIPINVMNTPNRLRFPLIKVHREPDLPTEEREQRRSSEEQESVAYLAVRQKIHTEAHITCRPIASPRTMRKHFSFYESRSESPALDHQPHHHATKSLSLLSQVKHLDQHKVRLFDVKENGQGDPIHRSHIPPLTDILQRMLLQTIEATADPRWEVRRMGQQVLPFLTEVIRWYNMQHLLDLWNSHLKQTTSVMTYGACMALRQTVAHAGRLIPLLNDPPITWQDVEMCCDTVKTITDPIYSHIARWCHSVSSLLSRPVLDRLSLVAVHTLIVSHTHLSFPPEQKRQQEESITTFIKTVFIHAHRDVRLSKDLSKGMKLKPFSTPLEGFLSCNVKEGSQDGFAKQLEKQLLKTVICGGHTSDFIKTCDIYNIVDILPILLFYIESSAEDVDESKVFIEWKTVICGGHTSDFIKTCDIYNIVDILPILLFYIESSAEDVDESKVFIECVGAMAMKTGECLLQGGQDEKRRHVVKIGALTLGYLSHMITVKDIDVAMLRQLLDIYLVFTTQLWDSKQLLSIFQAIATRTNSLVNPKLSSSHPTDEDLVLMSNDIPQTFPQNDDDSDSSSDEDNAAEHVPDPLLQECGALNSSGNSDRGGRLSAMSGSVDMMDGRVPSPVSPADDGSDWDDWSDEEEDQSALSDVFGSFLNRLKTCYLASGKSRDFQQEFLKLPDRDKKLLKGLCDQK